MDARGGVCVACREGEEGCAAPEAGMGVIDDGEGLMLNAPKRDEAVDDERSISSGLCVTLAASGCVSLATHVR